MKQRASVLRRVLCTAAAAGLALLAGASAQAQTDEELRNYSRSGGSEPQFSGYGAAASSNNTGGGADPYVTQLEGAGLAGMRLDQSFNSLGAARGIRDADSSFGTSPWDLGEAQHRGVAQRKPSQFQRFVQEATGRWLPIFGQELFSPPQVAYVPDANAPAPDDYVLGPGDEVRVRVWGSINYEGNLTLDRNGQINIPRAGAVNLAGVRVKDVENAIRSQVGKTFTNFRLSSNPGKLSSIQIYVVGQAEQPGSFTVSSLSTLVNALFVAGGPNANGSMRAIQLRRQGEVIATLDLYDFIAQGDSANDAALLPGDVIVIPPAGPRVAVAGALDNAAIYELKPGADVQTTLGDVLQLSGGVPTLARLQKALLERVTPDQKAPRRVDDIALDAAGLQTALHDGDIVTLLDINPEFANAVTLQGNVATPARYRWFEGMRIRDLIPDQDALITPDYHRRKNLLVQLLEDDQSYRDLSRQSPASQRYERRDRAPRDHDARQQQAASGVSAGRPSSDLSDTQANDRVPALPFPEGGGYGADAESQQPNTKRAGRSLDQRVRNMVDQINWDYAVIERLDRQQLRTRLIPFNLGRAVLQNDDTQNLPLEPGDIVTILSQNDLKLPQEKRTRLVRVEGEVAAPGIYEARPGETLEQLIGRVGGLTERAYLFGTEVERVSVREKQQENLDMLIRRMEQQQQSQILFILANRNSGDPGSQAALIQQQQQLARAQLQSLRQLRSNGRIALELDPMRTELAALPDLQLEDGDRIFVPPTPGFVTAVGAVNNENVFIYRPGRTIADVTKVAGLREEADTDEMFVLRADGSIVSRSSPRGLFRSFEGMKLMPGDTVVVPEKLDRETTRNFVARQLKDWTQIISQFGLGVAAIKVIRDL